MSAKGSSVPGTATKDQTIMVTGGSGFIGQHVVSHFAGRGRTVVAVYYRRLPEARENVYPVCSDMSSAELLAAPLRGVDTVVHLAWEGGLAGPDDPTQIDLRAPATYTRNLQLLRNLILAMERAGTRRFVLVSAVGASRDASSPFLREKYFGEFLLLNSRIPEKIILRSTVVWGGKGGSDPFLKSIKRVMRYPIYPVPRRTGEVSPIHVKDLAEAIGNASTQKLAETSAILDICGGTPYRVQELLRIVSDRCVKKTRFALGGFLGNSLLPFLDRTASDDPRGPKLAHFLAIGGQSDATTRVANPLVTAIPSKMATFADKVLE